MNPADFPQPSDILAIGPQCIVAVLAMIVLLADAIAPKMSKRALANISDFQGVGGTQACSHTDGRVKETSCS